MKDKINNVINKISNKKVISKNYYDDSKGVDDKEEEFFDYRKEYKRLKKENEFLKSDLTNKALTYFKNRRSVRKFVKDKKPDFKKIFNIIEASMNAPCAGNIQNYKIIVVDDEKIKRECAKLAFQQYWIETAPYLLIITRDNMHVDKMYPNTNSLFSIQNVSALIENIIMTTHFSELSCCWVAVDDNNAFKQLLDIPDHIFVDAIIPIGYSDEKTKKPYKSPTNALVDFQKYGNKNK